jgi:hypothetical protein
MYPNPQDVLPLPPHTDVEHYRRRAGDLAGACRSGDDAMRSWAAGWVARLLDLQPDASPRPSSREEDRQARQIADFASERLARSGCALSQARFVVARVHGFASWPGLLRHVEGLADTSSGISAFERAADAIVRGDLPALEALLARDPALVRARSTRAHAATLLHYVSANGVENFRQKTPDDVVTIARLLLDAGADVDAEADVYGGGATTLGLVVTSAHPRQAGVQLALADLLLERGARIDAGLVRSCLMNGCPEAAAHMVARGAAIGAEEAAGIGRLDVLAGYFDPPRTAPRAEAAAALIMATWYGRGDVVAFLLDRGVDVGAPAPEDGETALHVAAYRGSSDVVELLLRRGAPVNVTDRAYRTPPLVWALHAWLVERRAADPYRTVLRLLVEAGARVEPEWIDDERLRADADLHAVLSRRAGTA